MGKTARTTALRRVIRDKLVPYCGRVYFGQADAKTERPYLVCVLNEISYADGLALCELEVNAVDYGTDTNACETLADEIQEALDHWVYLDDAIEFAVYRDRRQSVAEEDRKVIRRRITFEIRLHERM